MSDNTDIMQRLRGQSVGDYSVLLWEAADEIERLRANLPQLWRTKTTNAKLRADLAQRTAERDEARREVFKALKVMYTTAGLRCELMRRGWWDWYKEVRP
jgi:hypothetical protein